jgi:salicylate biosynthesis isochorismate synthase/menaquinone-specific isochorismate synthase
VDAERSGGPRLVSATCRLDEDADPAAAAFHSRLASDRWFCWEQPDRGFALAGWGTVAEVVSRGPDRFAEVAHDCAELINRAVLRGAEGLPAGAGAVWVGGFAFADEGGGSSPWSSFAPASMTLPEVALTRSAQGSYVTVSALTGREPADAVARRIGASLSRISDAALPLLDPAPAGTRIESVRSAGEFERAVSLAKERIAAGRIEKVVLAREVRVEAAAAHDPAALFGALREVFPACFCFCCGTPEAAFLGASPELLVRRSGAGVSTVALAGSTRRSSDPSVDDHLGERLLRSAKDRSEQAIVARRIERALQPHSVWVEAAAEPGLAKIANIQHLATPIRAQLAEPRSAIEIAGLLHPTPAVGGEPWPGAAEALALEQLDRGWYAGPVGWMDSAEDGEFCVGLRSALLRDRTAHLYAGVGVVADSDPAAELAETEIKLEALLPLLTA